MQRLLLASASPRRRQLLEQVGYDVVVCAADVDESPLAAESPLELAVRLAVAKGRAAVARLQGDSDLPGTTVAADTVVWLEEGVQLGKPGSADEAAAMLRTLRGRTHRVTTAVAVFDTGSGELLTTFSRSTAVTMRSVSEAEVLAYAQTAEPRDKAGGYAIQGKAALFVEAIDGSYSNVVGLPVEALHTVLLGLGRTSGAPWAAERGGAA